MMSLRVFLFGVLFLLALTYVCGNEVEDSKLSRSYLKSLAGNSTRRGCNGGKGDCGRSGGKGSFVRDLLTSPNTLKFGLQALHEDAAETQGSVSKLERKLNEDEDNPKYQRKIKRLQKVLKLIHKTLKNARKALKQRKSARKALKQSRKQISALGCSKKRNNGANQDQCKKLFCRARGLRRQSRRARKVANALYDLYNLQRRLAQLRGLIRRIKKEQKWRKANPGKRRKVKRSRKSRKWGGCRKGGRVELHHFHHFKKSLLETEAETESEQQVDTEAESQSCPFATKPYEDDPVQNWKAKQLKKRLTRAYKRVSQIENEIEELKSDLARLRGRKFPLDCASQRRQHKKHQKKHHHGGHKHHKKHRVPFHFCTSCASGDPHTDTFDGHHHDIMVSGWFTWVQNPVITVQAYSQLGCMPRHIPNTCIRYVVVRITPPGTGETLIVSGGHWPPTGTTHNVIVQDSTGPNINLPPRSFRGGTFLGGKYNVRYAGGRLTISPTAATIADHELAVSVTIATYLLVVTLPGAAPHTGGTNGLMGFFNRCRAKNWDAGFRYRDGRSAHLRQHHLWPQRSQVLAWAASHVVSGAGGPNPPISVGHTAGLQQQKYLNSYHQHIRHNGFVEMDSEMVLGNEHALAETFGTQDDGFSIVPKATKPVVLPGHVPEVTPEKLAFCNKILKKVVKNPKDFKTQLKSCLQDADNPNVAKTVAAGVKTKRVQTAKAKKALRKEVKRKALIKAGKNAQLEGLKEEQKELGKEAAGLAHLALKLSTAAGDNEELRGNLQEAARLIADSQDSVKLDKAARKLLDKFPVN